MERLFPLSTLTDKTQKFFHMLAQPVWSKMINVSKMNRRCFNNVCHPVVISYCRVTPPYQVLPPDSNLAFPAHRLAACEVSAWLNPKRNFAGWIVLWWGPGVVFPSTSCVWSKTSCTRCTSRVRHVCCRDTCTYRYLRVKDILQVKMLIKADFFNHFGGSKQLGHGSCCYFLVICSSVYEQISLSWSLEEHWPGVKKMWWHGNLSWYLVQM